MMAKFIYEKFTEDSDPIKDMGIGMTPRLRIAELIKKLAKYNITATCYDYSDEGNIEINIESNQEDFNGVKLYYSTTEAAKESEGEWQEGFELSDGNHTLIKNTHDIEPVVKAIVKAVYGTPLQMDRKIKKLIKDTEKKLNSLKRIQKLMSK